MSRDENQRTIRVTKAVKIALVELRLLDQTVAAPVLDQRAVDDVERALECRLPDDILALYAAQCDGLADLGVVLNRVGPLTSEAHAAGCPKELIAIARGEGTQFVCISRGKEGAGEVHEFDSEDRAVRRRSLADWLGSLVDARRDDPAEPGDDADDEDGGRSDVEVAKADLDSFKPVLLAPPKATGKRVRHATFGEGDVLREIGAGDSRKLEVRFDIGTKVLIARVLEEI